MKKAILDGTIDCISSHHQPHDTDNKVVEFEQAAFGMIGLETTYAVLKASIPEVTDPQWVNLLSTNTRKIFGLDTASIKENKQARLTIFEPDTMVKVDQFFIRSTSKNTPFLGKTLQGRIIGIISNNITHLVR